MHSPRRSAGSLAAAIAPLAAVAALLALAGCGQKTDLSPAVGKQLPVAPYGREVRPSIQALLKPTTQAVPERSVELRKRSQEREDDPYDLPPPE